MTGAQGRPARTYAPRMPLTADAHDVCTRLRREIRRVGWSETARRSGIERTALHRAFRPAGVSDGLMLSTVANVAAAVGLELTVRERRAG